MDVARWVVLAVILAISDGHASGCECSQLGVAETHCVGVVGDFVRLDGTAKAAIEQGNGSRDLGIRPLQGFDQGTNGGGTMLACELLCLGPTLWAATGITGSARLECGAWCSALGHSGSVLRLVSDQFA
jgi:hypothetical protein